ncbi:cellulase family glycosylhydrolase [Chitinophaga polysaccharea]|uniref:cellulase family glycosylhydrolase n=1 Tax=Chitinophaga polysaccharea TaxID=1293035 RepID=UPI001C94F0CF
MNFITTNPPKVRSSVNILPTPVTIGQIALWAQIANYFKNYNERLLFASANEPAVSDATGMSVLLSYHQTFINAVRATGGNNSSRSLIIQGLSWWKSIITHPGNFAV